MLLNSDVRSHARMAIQAKEKRRADCQSRKCIRLWTHLFRRDFFVPSIAHHHIGGLTAESCMDTFETTLFANLRGTVDILDIEHPAEAIENHFR